MTAITLLKTLGAGSIQTQGLSADVVKQIEDMGYVVKQRNKNFEIIWKR